MAAPWANVAQAFLPAVDGQTGMSAPHFLPTLARFAYFAWRWRFQSFAYFVKTLKAPRPHSTAP